MPRSDGPLGRRALFAHHPRRGGGSRGCAQAEKCTFFAHTVEVPRMGAKGARRWRRCYVRGVKWLLLVGGMVCGAGAAASAEVALDGRAVRLTDGAASLAVAPRIVIESRADERGTTRARTLAPASWRFSTVEGGFAVEAEVADDEVRARFRIERAADDAAPSLTVEVEHLRASWVRLVALDLDLPGSPSVLDCALRPRATGGAVYLDRFAAKQVRSGGHLFLVEDGVDGAVVKPGVLRVELFSVEERPFRHDGRCARRWKSPNPKVVSTARLRAAGDRERARI